jgi:hypothetical protein
LSDWQEGRNGRRNCVRTGDDDDDCRSEPIGNIDDNDGVVDDRIVEVDEDGVKNPSLSMIPSTSPSFIVNNDRWLLPLMSVRFPTLVLVALPLVLAFDGAT